LQFLPYFFLLCRAKGYIFFRPNMLRRTHNPLVQGSNPCGPTNIFNKSEQTATIEKAQGAREQ
jgi:hypothetical protein